MLANESADRYLNVPVPHCGAQVACVCQRLRDLSHHWQSTPPGIQFSGYRPPATDAKLWTFLTQTYK